MYPPHKVIIRVRVGNIQGSKIYILWKFILLEKKEENKYKFVVNFSPFPIHFTKGNNDRDWSRTQMLQTNKT